MILQPTSSRQRILPRPLIPMLPIMLRRPPPAYGAPPPAYGYQPHPDEVRTLFLTGFPEDVKERELNNLLRFLPAYEVRWHRMQSITYCQYSHNLHNLLDAAELCHTGISNAPQEWHGTRICLVSKWCCGKSSCGKFAQHGVSCHTLSHCQHQFHLLLQCLMTLP